jgi:hypothetical protein
MKFIGLLMVAHENDVLREILTVSTEHLDAFYVLDGTVPNDESRRICESFDNCAGYMTDAMLDQRFGEKPVCGWRQAIYEMAVEVHGFDNWFVLLHGDEMLMFDPHALPARYPGADGFVCRLPFYFPREGEPWDDRPPLEQLHWRLGPGYPEFRMFKGGEHVAYAPEQRYNTQPSGLESVVTTADEIRHYLYRGPDEQLARAQRHVVTEFDLDNYRHVLAGAVYWTDSMIAQFRSTQFYPELTG